MHLLTPLDSMRRDIPEHPTIQDFALLKRRWGVSIATLVRTARRLGKSTTRPSLFKQMSARGERLRERVAIASIKPRGSRAMAETIYGPHPAEDLAEAALWTPAFAEDVLSRHATGSRTAKSTRHQRGEPRSPPSTARIAYEREPDLCCEIRPRSSPNYLTGLLPSAASTVARSAPINTSSSKVGTR